MIVWPAVIHHAGQAELSYISDQSQWHDDAQHAHGYRAEDRLIDSAGNMFSLNKSLNNFVAPAATGKTIQLDILINLLRQHAAQTGQCCVDKLSASSISEAIFLIGTMAHAA